MASLIGWAHQIGNIANRVYHQVSPFDNGATYQNPRPGFHQVNGTWYANPGQPQQQQQAPPPRQLPGPPQGNRPLQISQINPNRNAPAPQQQRQVTPPPPSPQLPGPPPANQPLQIGQIKINPPAPLPQHPAVSPLAPIAHGIANVAGATAGIPFNAGRVLGADLVHNPQAAQQASQNLKQNLTTIGQTGQQIARSVPETASTIVHPFTQHTFNPSPGIEQTLFGKTPIQNIQKKVANNFQQHSNLPLPQRIGLAGLEGIGSVANDAAVVAPLAKGVSTGIKIAAKAAPATALKDTAFKAMSAAKPQLTSLDQSGKLRLPFGSSQNQSFHYSAPTNGYTKLSGKASDVRAQLTKLNEQGGINNKPPESQPPDFLKTSPEYAAAHPPAQTDAAKLADLSPKEQMALHSPNGPLAPAAENTARNPFKANIPTVAHNDFPQVIANEQVASQIGKDNVLRSMAQVKKTNPQEFKNFWEYANGDPGFKDAPKSPQLQQALKAWRTADNRIHGNSQALGGNTNYLQDHGLHPVVFNNDMTNQLISGADPNKFSGLHNLTRQHPTMASLRAAAEQGGFSVGTDPLSEANAYLSASEHALRRRAIIKGVGEADGANMDKTHNLTLGIGDKNVVPISSKAHNELRGLQRSIPTTNQAVKGLRTANVGTKSTLLSFGQFHPINISGLRATPTLAIPKPTTLLYRNKTSGKLGIDPTMSSHPVRAAKGLYSTFRPLVPKGGTNFAAKVSAKAVADGMDLKAARIGAPYNAQLFDASGSSIAGVGHKLLGRQMLGMHDQAVRSVVSDLEKRGIPLDSPEARTAGKAVNNLMGFINNEAQKIPPVVSRQMGDWLLARQFTHSKFSQLRTGATNGGVGGAYARANVAANVVASTGIIVGVGYLLKQKSDSIRDALIRALTDPAIPTPMKDSRGNTVKLRIPGTDVSDIAKLLGIKPVRNPDGHLGISWKPGNMPSTVSDYLRARLAPLPGVALKVATNENYAGKPLYDPSAPFGTKVEQGATTALSGLLPIGAQGLPMTKAIEKHLPGNVQDVINANKPGGNPLIKSLGSSFGVTPTTDATTGKALDTNRYFAAANDALKQTTNNSEKTALQNYLGSKKNPVTGKYDTSPNPNDTGRKAKDLLDAPRDIGILIDMNRKLKAQGAKTDPLWNLSSDQVTKVLQYETMPYGGPDKKHWLNQNQSWYGPLSNQRQAFFNSLPAGDPNKPKQPIEFPSPTPQVAAKQQQYFNITDAAQRAKFLQDNPDVQAQLDKSVQYNNDMRVATLGAGSALDTFPKASPQVQQIINAYNAVPKGGGKKGGNKFKAQWIQSHPKEYAAMTQYFTQASLYGLEQDASQAQFKDTGFSSKGLGDIYNVGNYDIKQGKSASGAPVYALTTGQSGGTTYSDQNGNTFADLGQASGSSSSGSSSSSSSKSSTSSSGKIKSPKIKGIKVGRISSGRKSSGSARPPKAITSGFKISKSLITGPKMPKAPKGVKIKVPSQPKQPKLSVAKIPQTGIIYKTKKNSVV